MQKIFPLLIVVSLVSACQNHSVNSMKISSLAGPKVICPNDNSIGIFRKTNQKIDQYEQCFSKDVEVLIKRNQVLSKIEWFKLQSKHQQAIVLLKKAINLSSRNKTLSLELAKYYIALDDWNNAYATIVDAEIEVNNPVRVLVESKLNIYTIGTNPTLIPQIYKNKKSNKRPERAVVITDESLLNDATNFELTRVDNSGMNELSGESSIKSSNDGQNVIVTWTESGSNEDSGYYWRLKSSRSSDAGATWESQTISPFESVPETYHFDPMTAYDPYSDLIYYGGLSVSYSSENVDTSYIYRWDLNTDIQEGPFFSPKRYDKGWLAVDEDSSLILASAFFQYIQRSTDFGETFENHYTSGQKLYYFPQPMFKNGCLYVIDTFYMQKCDGKSSFIDIEAPFSSIFDSGAYNLLVPGTFRLFPYRVMAVHPSGDIFILYPDVVELGSKEVALWMSSSRNDGESWKEPWIITPKISADRYNHWMDIDSDGNIHVSYMDTRNAEYNDESVSAAVDVYYSTSSNKGKLWYETRVTPTSLQIPELIWGDYFFSDFLEMSAKSADSVYLSFPWSQNTGEMHMYIAKKY